MAVAKETYQSLVTALSAQQVTLIAVSKTKPVSDIQELYALGQRDFGENYVQELVEKQAQLPLDIRWHFIGHLQSNKVKYIAPFVHLIHGVDSVKLAKEIDRQAQKNARNINFLWQVHIAREETKFGLDEQELKAIFQDTDLQKSLTRSRCQGFMGMASFSDDKELVRQEFHYLRSLFELYKNHQEGAHLSILSMGMSGDYQDAISEGSNMVRIGSLLFGQRTKPA